MASNKHLTRAAGQEGEDLAVLFLQRRGYRILERNFRTPYGEIDIIARHGLMLCCIEVKLRRGQRCGSGAEAIDRRKQQRLIKSILWYARRFDSFEDISVRFDALIIQVNADNGAAGIELIADAFQASED